VGRSGGRWGRAEDEEKKKSTIRAPALVTLERLAPQQFVARRQQLRRCASLRARNAFRRQTLWCGRATWVGLRRHNGSRHALSCFSAAPRIPHHLCPSGRFSTAASLRATARWSSFGRVRGHHRLHRVRDARSTHSPRTRMRQVREPSMTNPPRFLLATRCLARRALFASRLRHRHRPRSLGAQGRQVGDLMPPAARPAGPRITRCCPTSTAQLPSRPCSRIRISRRRCASTNPVILGVQFRATQFRVLGILTRTDHEHAEAVSDW